MVMYMIITDYDPVVDAVSQTIKVIVEIVISFDNVPIKKRFAELSRYLGRIVPLLRELNSEDTPASEGLRTFLNILNLQTEEAKKLIRSCTQRNMIYLLVNSRTIVKHIGGDYEGDPTFSIAKAVGVSTDRCALKKELSEFKSKIENYS
ncbi:hypothetical protein ACS0TY_018146 [Phlomoides rotata]